MYNKQKKGAALQALRDARSRKDQGLHGGIDEVEIKEEEDVYDEVAEEEYQKLVEARRQREDFVVDDGTYHILLLPLSYLSSCFTLPYLGFVGIYHCHINSNNNHHHNNNNHHHHHHLNLHASLQLQQQMDWDITTMARNDSETKIPLLFDNATNEEVLHSQPKP